MTLPTARGRARTIRLSPVELLACWTALELPDPPSLLRIRRPSGAQTAQHGTRRRLATALSELAGRGLSDGTLPTPALTRGLRLLAAADHLLDIRFTGPAGRAVLGLGAVVGAEGVTVVSNDGLGPIDVDVRDGAQVLGALVGLLGPVPPGIGNPVNIPTDLLDAAGSATRDGSMWSLADQLRARGIARAEAASLARMLTGVDFGGQLGVTARRAGTEHRGPWVVGFTRAHGKYFVQLRRNGTLSMYPTDADRLVRHWRELLDHTR